MDDPVQSQSQQGGVSGGVRPGGGGGQGWQGDVGQYQPQDQGLQAQPHDVQGQAGQQGQWLPTDQAAQPVPVSMGEPEVVGVSREVQRVQEVRKVREEQSAEVVDQDQGESVPITEVDPHREIELSQEVGEFVKQERKEHLRLEEKVEYEGKVLVQPSGGTDEPEVVVPMTKQSLVQNIHGKVGRSATWLATWCMRLIKKFHGRVAYSSAEN